MLIAIAGKDGVGKSTLAGKLAVLFGDAMVLAFATRLREMCIADGVLTRLQAYAKPMDAFSRGALRSMSLAYKKQYGDTIFADTAKQIWTTSNAKVAILHDMRYSYEAEAIRQSGGLIVYVGSNVLTDEEAEMDSFKHLPGIDKMADFTLGFKPSDNCVNALHHDLLAMM